MFICGVYDQGGQSIYMYNLINQQLASVEKLKDTETTSCVYEYGNNLSFKVTENKLLLDICKQEKETYKPKEIIRVIEIPIL